MVSVRSITSTGRVGSFPPSGSQPIISTVELVTPGAKQMLVDKIKPLFTATAWAFGLSVGLSLMVAL